MIYINAIGDVCPLPVIKAKKAIENLQGAGSVCVLVDNEIAVQNLAKLAQQKGYSIETNQAEKNNFQVVLTKGKSVALKTDEVKSVYKGNIISDKVVVISADTMGDGDEKLGKVLMHGFIFALTEQEQLPGSIVLYNSGAKLSCTGSLALSDLKKLEQQGVEILTCGTCLNYYQLQDKLQVGKVTNMYNLAERMLQAEVIIKP